MLYGAFVRNNPDFLRDHRLTDESSCLSYWEDEPLGEAALESMIRAAGDKYAAFSAQSFSNTPVSSIRSVLDRLQGRADEQSAPLAPAPTGEAQIKKSMSRSPS
jgi:hypothetical protein